MEKRFGRSLDQLSGIVRFTDCFFEHEKADSSLRYIVDLCIEELFVNMATYNTETESDILIEMSLHGRGVQVSLTDYDVERFDPREAKGVNIDAPLDERTPGGLGLYLVLKMTDSVEYAYRDRTSKVTFIVNRKQEDVANHAR